LDDYCLAGQCLAGDNACVCQADDDCAGEEDGNLCNGTLYCDTAAEDPLMWNCVIDPATVVFCDDSMDDECRISQCQSDTGECALVPVNEAGQCDDGSVCSTVDVCAAGKCGGTEFLDCSDGNLCTDDYCHPLAACQHATEVDGTSCGGPGWVCLSGQCEYCEPDCVGKQCGNDGCGGECGTCGPGTVCANNVCVG